MSTSVSAIPSGRTVGDGRYALDERMGFTGMGTGATNLLPLAECQLLAGPGQHLDTSVSGGELMLSASNQMQSWSSYYASSFYISECAGRGANGEVWRGIALDGTERRVVLKRVYAAKTTGGMSSAMREVYFGLKLGDSHPHWSRFVSHFVENGDLWLVFFDEGVSLYQAVLYPRIVGELSMMTRSGFWRQLRNRKELFVDIFSQVFVGLADLHRLGIVHRDIKLENVFLDPLSKRVRIGDFGSACIFPMVDESLRNLFPPDGKPSINEETSRYSPPEVREGEGLLAGVIRVPSFDIWCVGIMWIELFLGTIDLGSGRSRLCALKRSCSKEEFADDLKRLDPLGVGMEAEDAMLDVVWALLAWRAEDRPSAENILIDFPFFQKELMYPLVVRREPLFRVQWSQAENQGGRTQMEDRFCAEKIGNIFFLACVFDGHNGWEVAELARARLPDILRREVSERADPNLRSVLTSGLGQLSAEIDDANDTLSETVGSTAACALIDLRSGEFVTAHVGDSRIVLVEEVDRAAWEPQVGGRIAEGRIFEVLRPDLVVIQPNENPEKRRVVRDPAPPSNSVRVTCLTRDHKPNVDSEKAYIESVGGFVSDSNRVNGVLAVSRSIGAKGLKPFVRSEPEGSISSRFILKGKIIILSTDGVFDLLSNQEVGEREGPEAIVSAAMRAGGRDNMMVLELRLEPPTYRDEL